MALSKMERYPMDSKKLGVAYIINNVSREMPFTQVDVDALEEAYTEMGFQVRTQDDCDTEKMDRLLEIMMKESLHKDKSCFLITLICHGVENSRGLHLLGKGKHNGWYLEYLVSRLSSVKSLQGKPKIIVVQACRTMKGSRALADDESDEEGAPAAEVTSPFSVCPPKADMYIAFSTVPGHRAHAGEDAEGSLYLQTLSRLLLEHHQKLDLRRIHEKVINEVASHTQTPEERSSLRLPVYLCKPEDLQTPGQARSKNRPMSSKVRSRTTETPRRVKLQHLSTHDTGLAFWERTKFTVMPSGEVVFWGKTSEEDTPGLHWYQRSATGWRKLRRQEALCEHQEDVNLLPMTVENKELLAVSCWDCETIRLNNRDSVAFHHNSYYPGGMCHGEEGQMYVVHSVQGPTPILQLNCSSSKFSVNKTIQSGMETYFSICYIPGHRLIVISRTAGIIRAVSCDSDERVWEVQGKVEGVQCYPHGMVYSPGLDALFVADGYNTRILVLNPGDGSLRQVVPLSDDMGVVHELHLYNDEMVVHHGWGDRTVKVSYFSVQ